MNPTLLYNDECAVCRAIASWVKSSARTVPDAERLAVRPIGDDPAALRALDPALDIWDAYATIHLLMPDGSTKCGGGTPNAWVKAVRDPLERAMVAIGRARKSKRTPHFTPSTPRSSG
jgi:hypothetical protein